MNTFMNRKQSHKQAKSWLIVFDFGSFFLIILAIAYGNLFANPVLFLGLAAFQMLCFAIARIYEANGLAKCAESIPNKRSKYSLTFPGDGHYVNEKYEEKMPNWERRLYVTTKIVTGVLITTALTFAILGNSVGPLWAPGLLTNPLVLVGASMISYLFTITSGIFTLLGVLRVWDRVQQRKQGIAEASAPGSKVKLTSVKKEGNWKVARAVFSLIANAMIAVGIGTYFIGGITTLPASIVMVGGIGLMLVYKAFSKGFHDSQLVPKIFVCRGYGTNDDSTQPMQYKVIPGDRLQEYRQAKARVQRPAPVQVFCQLGHGLKDISHEERVQKLLPEGFEVAKSV